MILTLRCWQCGKTIDGEANRQPQFSFEVVEMAEQVGWVGVIDMARGRSLVFCSGKCDRAAKKKDGSYRLRPKSIVKNYGTTQ